MLSAIIKDWQSHADDSITQDTVTRAIAKQSELDSEAQLLYGNSNLLRLSFRAAGGNLDQVCTLSRNFKSLCSVLHSRRSVVNEPFLSSMIPFCLSKRFQIQALDHRFTPRIVRCMEMGTQQRMLSSVP